MEASESGHVLAMSRRLDLAASVSAASCVNRNTAMELQAAQSAKAARGHLAGAIVFDGERRPEAQPGLIPAAWDKAEGRPRSTTVLIRRYRPDPILGLPYLNRQLQGDEFSFFWRALQAARQRFATLLSREVLSPFLDRERGPSRRHSLNPFGRRHRVVKDQVQRRHSVRSPVRTLCVMQIGAVEQPSSRRAVTTSKTAGFTRSIFGRRSPAGRKVDQRPASNRPAGPGVVGSGRQSLTGRCRRSSLEPQFCLAL